MRRNIFIKNVSLKVKCQEIELNVGQDDATYFKDGIHEKIDVTPVNK